MNGYRRNSIKGSTIKLIELLQRAELCLNSIQLNRSDVVLEIGCGSGGSSLLLSKRCKRVTAIDIYEPLIEWLSSRQHTDNVKFLAIDTAKNPPQSLCNTFDKFICINVMEHGENPLGLLSFSSHILRHGGKGVMTFPISNPFHGENYFTRDSLLALVAESDLETTNRILKTDIFGLLLRNFVVKMQSLLVEPPIESDRFNDYTYFKMMQKPKKVHNLYKFAISLLFVAHKNPFYECKSGDRALILFEKKPDNLPVS